MTNDPAAVRPKSSVNDDDDVEHVIRELDARVRADLAHDAPPLSIPVATWALRLIEQAARCFTYRDIEPEEIATALSVPPPDAPTASRFYSADLFLRYLPDIARLARSAGPDDPLVRQLDMIGCGWPLSSVGMADVTCELGAVEAVLANPCLRQLYVDRVIERQDTSRLQLAAVRAAVREALGAHVELAQGIVKKIDEIDKRVAEEVSDVSN